MNVCECGCGGTPSPGKRFVLHHHWRKKIVLTVQPPSLDALTLEQAAPILEAIVGPQPPPHHPLPFDHGKFRIAEEQPGTDLTQPWVLDYCVECRLPTWTHNAQIAAKHESMCETCSYMLFTELSEARVAKENRTQRGTYNPFDT